MQVKFKKLNSNAVIPTYGTPGSAGLDLTATSKVKKYNDGFGYLEYIEMGTDLALEIPEGYVGLVYPRSSISKYNVALCNSVGVIDASYRGEIKLRFKPTGSSILGEYEVGDKVAQLMIVPYPEIELVEAKELTETERGEGGFGSTTYVKEKSQAW